ncbi:MAG TPA: tRNA (adenosine(37)-N6)-threonylcarbamoyltransferase complex dimerization subunit type 1 TsaB [Paenibacillus sp.]|nr:tRNA (adenosine(37)-N6)-threonylcarbamoyltransferase complex dimerization subunit type 1 TsaB [Paenibacillus sp.]
MSELRGKGEAVAGVPDGPLLSIDTSTPSMTMALTVGDEVLVERTTNAERNHSVQLLPEIDALVRSAGLRPREVRAVAVGCGPGSYTGVRIGVTMAKTFAWALGLPVYGVSSLEALAYGGWRDAFAGGTTAVQAPAWIVPALDARRGQAYTALFEASGDAGEGGGSAWRRASADAVVPFQGQAEAWLGAADRPGTVVFVGEVDGSFADMLDAAASGAQAVVLRRPWAMAARDIAAVARLHGETVRVRDPHDLLPNYAQLAEAEAKLAAAGEAAARERARERN